MKTNKNKYLTLIALALSIISCDSKRVYDTYVSLSDQSWEESKPVLFSFNVKDTTNTKNLFVNIRNNEKYEFSNLYIITELNFPNGKKIVDTLQYQMTDPSGNFLGKGFTDIKENKLFYKEKVLFPFSGDYTVSVSHAMRKNGEINGITSLKGITEVGFRIEKN